MLQDACLLDKEERHYKEDIIFWKDGVCFKENPLYFQICWCVQGDIRVTLISPWSLLYLLGV